MYTILGSSFPKHKVRVRFMVRIKVRIRIRVRNNEPYALFGITNLQNDEI